MFQKKGDQGYVLALDGIHRKTVAFGNKTLMSEFKLKKGSTLPQHTHPYEQTGYLINGRMTLCIGEEQYDVEPGDSWCIPENVQHSALTLEDSIAVEVFSPLRKDYLP
jgi:quercetin dioxygenase-like cupin family protein